MQKTIEYYFIILLIQFYYRDAAKDHQVGHQVSHIPLQDRYTFNYTLNTWTTTIRKNKQVNKNKKQFA